MRLKIQKMSIHFLNHQDFKTNDGVKGKLLCTSIQGMSLLMFYSNRCPHSLKLLSVFKALPSSVPGCKIGVVDLDRDKRVIEMSKETITQITYVPYILLYINGKPFTNYNGGHTLDEIRTFIITVANQINTKQAFASAPSSSANNQQQARTGNSARGETEHKGSSVLGQRKIVKKIENSEGIPICAGQVCYVTQSELGKGGKV